MIETKTEKSFNFMYFSMSMSRRCIDWTNLGTRNEGPAFMYVLKRQVIRYKGERRCHVLTDTATYSWSNCCNNPPWNSVDRRGFTFPNNIYIHFCKVM